MIRRLGMCSSSSSSTSVGWQAGGCSFSASRLLCCGLVLACQLDWRQRWKKGGKGAIFSYQTPREHRCTCVFARVCLCLTLSICIERPYSHLSVCRQRGWRKFMLPIPVPSVELIRLRAPDNSIISDSFNNRNAPRSPQDAHTTVKPPVAQNYQTLLYFSIQPADKTEPSRLAQCPVGKAAPVLAPGRRLNARMPRWRRRCCCWDFSPLS